jgi:hypothetical protein
MIGISQTPCHKKKKKKKKKRKEEVGPVEPGYKGQTP